MRPAERSQCGRGVTNDGVRSLRGMTLLDVLHPSVEHDSVDGVEAITLPADLDLDRYTTAVVWCRAFSVLFARAPTQP